MYDKIKYKIGLFPMAEYKKRPPHAYKYDKIKNKIDLFPTAE